MTSIQIAELIRTILEDKKAQAIEIIEVAEKSILADYFIIATGTSVTHVRALSDEVSFQLKDKHQLIVKHIEGESTSRWILMDYGDIVVHLFHPEERDFYSLDKLWQMSRIKS